MRCKDCKHRVDGYCQNREKLHEDLCTVKDSSDHMIYDYVEGGGFKVGPEFGCVHFELEDDEQR